MRFKVILLLLTLSIIALLLSGCGGGGSAYDSFKGGTGETEWTVMVYMNADNDLEPYSIDNVNQMEKVGSGDRVKIVVQWDRTPGYSVADGNWEGTRRYEIVKDNTSAIKSRMIEDVGELDMGDPQVMKDFIAWAQQNYPARRYCLVIWNHGSGWRSMSPSQCAQSRNISFDDTSNTSINTRDLPDILRSAPQPFDVVAMDASLMQMIEVAYEMKGTARLLVGSEESPPGEGYVYDQWLAPLASNPSMDPFTLSRTIADKYIQAYTGSFPVTQSVVDLTQVSKVGLALDNFAGVIAPFAVSHAAALKNARENAQYYSYDDYKYKDLQDYAYRVTQAIGTPEVAAAYSALTSAMREAILYEANTGGDVANSHGLSIWVPDPATYQLYSTRYSALLLSQDTRWDTFLASQVE